MSNEESNSGPGLFSLTQIRHLMRTEFERAKRYEYPLTCMMIELDGIGSFRDRFGFDPKEALVDDLVGMLRNETRTCDYLGRMLDDRFLIVLPHTAAEGAAVLASRLQEFCAELILPEGSSDFPLRLSIGASRFEEGTPVFFDVLLEAAEAALESAAGGKYIEAAR